MDKDKRICKVCKEVKLRIHTGKYDGKTKRFEDEQGSHWNGNTCPECNKKRVKFSIRQLREIRNA